MPTYILNTCGTSIITNSLDNDFRKIINQYTNENDWQNIPDADKDKIKQHIAKRKQALLDADEQTVCKMSAELNGLLNWQKQHLANPQDMYALLATDTIFGQETANIIQAWLNNHGHQTTMISYTGLKTSSLTNFREALSGLVKTLIDTLTGYKDSGYDICFNLTGGFKSLNGFLQAISTIYADKTFYLFEGSKELLFIPKLPFTLNAEDVVMAHLPAFRRLANNLSISDEQKNAMPDSLLFTIDDEVTLSEWGELLWQSCYKQLYQKQLFASISKRVIYTAGFEESSKKISAALLAIVNERIAKLAEYAENDCKHMLQSLDAKPLQMEKYKQQNMWECDLDGNHRIFMIKNGYTFTLQKIDKALH